MTTNIIAAVGDDLAIGNGGRLLWRLPEDLRYFRKVTMGRPVIMGRRTFESIGKPLPGRTNIVLTRNPAARFPESVKAVQSLSEALAAAEESQRNEDGEVFIIGGAEIYRQTIGVADRLYITRVHAAPDKADAFFPQIDAAIWEIERKTEIRTDTVSGIEYEFLVYKRR